MKRCRIVILLWCLLGMVGPCFSEPVVVDLQGHLDKDKLQGATEKLQEAIVDNPSKVILDLNTHSGDLLEVLDWAQQLYELKRDNDWQLVVYIGGSVFGPGAMIPFVADKRVASLFAVWGDIPSGSEDVLPTNILRSRVRSLISNEDSHAALLRMAAAGMVDPALTIAAENGLTVVRADKADYNVVSSSGEALVLDHNQLLELELVEAVWSADAFRAHYGVSSQTASVDNEENLLTTSLALLPQEVKDRLSKNINLDPEQEQTIGYLHIDDKDKPIGQSTWIYIRSALDYYKKTRPAVVVLELNTPGGEVFAAQKISDALKDFDINYGIPVIAYVNNWAISAGAMIAYSCRFIAIAKDASMGAAEPVFAGGSGGMQAAPEKVNSALRADFSNRAGFFNRNPLIAEAMVDKEMILVVRHGKIIKLEDPTSIRYSGPDPDIVVTKAGKLLTLDAKEMIEYGVADMVIQPKEIPLRSSAEEAKGQWPAEKMALFHHPYLSHLGMMSVDEYQMDWKGHFLAFLAIPMVSSLLFLGLMLGFYTEFNTPGFGVPGILGLACLFFIILSSFSLEAAAWLELILLAAGMIFLSVELLVLPGFGLAGLLGVGLAAAGLLGMLLPGLRSISFDFNSQTFNAAGQAVMERVVWLSISFIVAIVAMILLSKYVMPRFHGFQRLVLKGEETTSQGYVSGNAKELPPIGSEGVVVNVLRPAGKVEIEGQVCDATSIGNFIEAGIKVVVVNIERSSVIVDRKK
ncbi:MAG: NfeD family protein [Chlamydiota bacterium]